MRYVPDVPPVGDRLMLPFPLGHTGCEIVGRCVIAEPILERETLAVARHPLLSATVTLYAPAIRPLSSAVLAPLDHKYLYGACPLLTTVTVALPLDELQVSAAAVVLRFMTRI